LYQKYGLNRLTEERSARLPGGKACLDPCAMSNLNPKMRRISEYATPAIAFVALYYFQDEKLIAVSLIPTDTKSVAKCRIV
jgi:hypothetical protein